MTRDSRDTLFVGDLNQMQRYLGEEAFEDYQEGALTRRQMLRQLVMICGGSAAAAALLTACGDAAADRPAPTQGAATSTVAHGAQAQAASPAAAAATAAPTAAVAVAATSQAPGAATESGAAIANSDVAFGDAAALKGYLARPKAEGQYPGVIVIHENRGLTDHIRDVARRVAKAGYVALAPDLASRAGGTAAVNEEQIRGYFANANPDELVRDLNAAVDFLGQQAGVVPDKYGVVGFCFGGAYTLRLAAANPKMAAAVCYYGVTPEPASQMSATNAAILGQYGGTDQRVNATIPALEQVMQQSGKTFEKRVYDGAGHAFNNDTGPNYNEAAAVEAWNATLSWFNTHLKG